MASVAGYADPEKMKDGGHRAWMGDKLLDEDPANGRVRVIKPGAVVG